MKGALRRLPRLRVSRREAPNEAEARSSEIAYGMNSLEKALRALERLPQAKKSDW